MIFDRDSNPSQPVRRATRTIYRGNGMKAVSTEQGVVLEGIFIADRKPEEILDLDKSATRYTDRLATQARPSIAARLLSKLESML